jgi:glycosyltransferase involved in cell wall biosynthesis
MKKTNSKFDTKLVFLSFYQRNYSRSSVLLNYQTDEICKEFFQISPGRKMIGQLYRIMKSNIGKEVVYVVMSPSSLILLVLKMLTKSRIILDCGWPMIDGFSARSKNKFRFIEYAKIRFIDLFSLRYADLILAESEQQIEKMTKDFNIPKQKFKVSFTGFDETRIKLSHTYVQNEVRNQKYALFRGKFNDESGLQNIISAFKSSLVDVNLIVITNRSLKDAVGIKNIKVINRHLPDQEIFDYIKNAEMCLGQLSEHPRLGRTIPHKSFESAYFGIPYISLRTDAMIEAFPEGCGVHYIDGPEELSICKAVLEIYNNDTYRTRLSKDIHKQFQNHLSQKKIADGFLELLYKNEFIK